MDETLTLDHFLKFGNGKTSPERFDSGRFPVFGANGIIGYSDSFNTQGPCIILGRVGNFCGSVHLSKTNCWVTDNAISAVPINDESAVFWFEFLKNTNLRSLAHGSGQPLITQKIIKSITAPKFTASEKTGIADVLGSLDDKITANSEVISSVSDLCLELAKKEIEATTEFSELGEEVVLNYGKSLPKSQRVTGNVAVVGSGGVVDFHDEKLIDGPAIVIGRKGSIGTIHWIDGDCYPIDTTFWVKPKRLPPTVVYQLLRTLDFSGFNTDSAVPGLNRMNAYSTVVPRLSGEQAHMLASTIEPLMAKSAALKAENETLARTRDELLPLLMSGKISVAGASESGAGAGVEG